MSASSLLSYLPKIAEDSSIITGLTGGFLIAVSSSALLYYTGNILGISGIVGKTVSNGKRAWKTWRIPFLTGLLAAGGILSVVHPKSFGSTATDSFKSTAASSSHFTTPHAAAVAGVLVGFGTRMANGCTSGHGVIGLARRSPRSLTAVLSFMCSAAISAYVIRTNDVVRSFVQASRLEDSVSHLGVHVGTGLAAAALLLGAFVFRDSWSSVAGGSSSTTTSTPAAMINSGANKKEKNELSVTSSSASVTSAQDSLSSKFASGIIGLVFGLGLGLSGMTDPEKLLGFLDFSRPQGWDLTMMGVMGGAVLVNMFTFSYMSTHDFPAICETTDSCGKPIKSLITLGLQGKNLQIDVPLVVGSVIFGVGWGMAGMCPGPALVSAAAGVPLALVVVPSMLGGFAFHDLIMGGGGS